MREEVQKDLSYSNNENTINEQFNQLHEGPVEL